MPTRSFDAESSNSRARSKTGARARYTCTVVAPAAVGLTSSGAARARAMAPDLTAPDAIYAVGTDAVKRAPPVDRHADNISTDGQRAAAQTQQS